MQCVMNNEEYWLVAGIRKLDNSECINGMLPEVRCPLFDQLIAAYEIYDPLYFSKV